MLELLAGAVNNVHHISVECDHPDLHSLRQEQQHDVQGALASVQALMVLAYDATKVEFV
jgi:hypothetical protein